MTPWFIALPSFHFWDFKKKETYHAARFEKDSRYYVLCLEKDLLGEWTIRAINGRIKSKIGQSRTPAFHSFKDAFTCFCDMAKIRYQRGYYLKTIACENVIFLSMLPFIFIKEGASLLKNETLSNKKEREYTRTLPIKKQINHQQMGFQF
ncbi:MAG: hypothetical protein H0T84_15075 [Tatlockia sp.]|nr:hypothetical protein [Tatlockia sp.]